MVILDGFTDFSHLLQQTRLHSKSTEAELQTSQQRALPDAHLHDVLQVLLCIRLLRHQLGRLEVRLDE